MRNSRKCSFRKFTSQSTYPKSWEKMRKRPVWILQSSALPLGYRAKPQESLTLQEKKPRDQKTGSGFGVWGRGGIPNGIRPLIFQPQKGTARDPLLIRWDLCPRRGGSTLGVLVLRHSETAPAEDVATHLNRTLFDEVCLASPARPHLAAMTFLRPGGCAVF